MSWQILEVIKTKFAGRTGYLLIGRSEMIFTDLNPKVVKEEPSTGKTVAVTPLFGVMAGAAYNLSKSIKVVDTEEKKSLREAFENYMKTRDKSLLNSISITHILKADSLLKSEGRIIPHSSISKVNVKKPRKIFVTQQVHTGLTAEIYGNSRTWEFDVLGTNEYFPDVMGLLKQLLPDEVFS